MFRGHRVLPRIVVLVTVLSMALFAGGVVSAQERTLSIFTMPHAGIPVVKATQAQLFKELHPDVNIELTDGWIDKLLTMIAGGVAPDIVYYSHEGFLSMASQELLLDLTPYIEREPGYKERFFPAAVRAGAWAGKQYAWAESVSTSGLFYNKNLFQEAGLAYPLDLTWDDLLRNARLLTRDLQNDGVIDQFGFSDRYPISGSMENWIWQAGGEIFTPDFSRALLNSPEAQRGLQFQYDLYYTHHVGPQASETESWGGPHRGPESMFRNGRLAMISMTRYYQAGPEGDINYEWDVAPLAAGPAGRAVGMAMDFLAIMSTSQQPDLAWEFITFVNDEEVIERVRALHANEAVMNGVPSNIEAARAYLEPLSRQYNELYWLESMADARPGSITRYPPAPADRVYRQFVNRLNEVIAGTITLEAMLEDFTRQLNNALAQK